MENEASVVQFQKVVGTRYVLTGERNTERFRKGYRSGFGEAICVIKPGTLLELWQVLKICVASDLVVIMQAANTGLTEGSTPNGHYDRGAVIISTLRIDTIHLLDNGKQVVCMPGSTLYDLENQLRPYGRQPHSVLGSSCIGASVIGGVCNNSGGSLVERGPSYTELSVFAQITENGELQLVNNIGLELGSDPETILKSLATLDPSSVNQQQTDKKASDNEYSKIVRDVDADTPARYNADQRCLHEASGCAGKLVVFAARLDTYPKNESEKVFYIGTNHLEDLTEIRRTILSEFNTLPVSGEYMHRDIIDITEKYGKDTVLMINMFGTQRLPTFFALKNAIDTRLNKIKIFSNITDKLLQQLAKLWPNILPNQLREYQNKYEHHLILKMHDEGIDEANKFLDHFFSDRTGDYFPCSENEGKIAELNRFAAAGAAIRYQKLYSKDVEDILALEFALRRNDRDWFEVLPADIDEKLIHKLYYGHFFCHVMHHDYVVKKGVDIETIKSEMLEILDERGAEYPAEHNVGHLYAAKPNLADFYKSIDPTNSLNPGIGKLSKSKHYADT